MATRFAAACTPPPRCPPAPAVPPSPPRKADPIDLAPPPPTGDPRFLCHGPLRSDGRAGAVWRRVPMARRLPDGDRHGMIEPDGQAEPSLLRWCYTRSCAPKRRSADGTSRPSGRVPACSHQGHHDPSKYKSSPIGFREDIAPLESRIQPGTVKISHSNRPSTSPASPRECRHSEPGEHSEYDREVHPPKDREHRHQNSL